jgi:hypothetical protein
MDFGRDIGYIISLESKCFERFFGLSESTNVSLDKIGRGFLVIDFVLKSGKDEREDFDVEHRAISSVAPCRSSCSRFKSL